MTWPPPSTAHPLDRAWAALPPAVQRQQASAEARAFYRQPCREWRRERDSLSTAALVDALVETIAGAVDSDVDDICPPLPGRPKRGRRT